MICSCAGFWSWLRSREHAGGLAALEAGDAGFFVGRHDVPAAVLFQVIDLAVGIERSGEIDCPEAVPAADEVARFGIDDLQLARIVKAIQPVFDLKDRAFADGQLEVLPELAGLRDVASQAGIDGDDGSHLGAGRILFAVTRIDDFAIDGWRDVQAAAR
jgi:hypothetical protein